MARELNFYQRWEALIDTTTFVGPEVVSLLVKQMPLLNPSGAGVLLATFSNVAMIQLSKTVLKANQRHSRFVEVCAVLMGIAVSTLAVPYLVNLAFDAKVVLLTAETAFDLAIANLVLKTAFYALYRIGSMFVGEAKGLSVRMQFSLKADLSKCTRIGEGWTNEEMRLLHQEDISKLPLELRKEINQLYFDNSFSPHDRDYETDEFPALPGDPFETGLTQEQLKWYNLILPDGERRNLGLTKPDNWQSHIKNFWNDYLGEHGHVAKIRKYHVILKEYQRILQSDFGINLKEKLKFLEKRKKEYPSLQYVQDLHRTVEILLFSADPAEKKEYNDARTQRGRFVQKLRDVIQDPKYQQLRDKECLSNDEKEFRFLTRCLADTIFRPEIFNYVKDVTKVFSEGCMALEGIDPKDEAAFSLETYETILDRKNRQIRGAPNALGKSTAALAYQKLLGALGFKDFIGSENTPHKRNEIEFNNTDSLKPWKIDYCRHGCPTTPGTPAGFLGGVPSRLASWVTGKDLAVRSGEAIAPEYEEMLYLMAERGEAAFYCNHQRRWPGGMENERDRVEALENLERRCPNFFLISQPVEGDLFKREGKYENIRTFEELKFALRDSYNQDDKNEVYAEHRLPRIIRENPELRKKYISEILPSLFKDVHEIFFDNRPAISFDGKDPVDEKKPYKLREWQLFIEAFYAMQRLDLIFRLSEHETTQGKFKVTRLKTVCKDFLDRGGNEAQIFDMLLYFMMENKPPNQWFEETAYNLLGAPIIVKKKEAIPRRIKPGMAMIALLRNLPQHKKDKLRSLAFGKAWKPTSIKVAKRPDQEAVPFTLSEIYCDPSSQAV